MRIVARLAAAHAIRHPAQITLTLLAVMAAACVVVWVVSGYDALVAQFDDVAEESLGRYDVLVLPRSARRPRISPELVARLAADPAVARVDAAMLCRVRVERDSPEGDAPSRPPRTGPAGQRGMGPAGQRGMGPAGQRGMGPSGPGGTGPAGQRGPRPSRPPGADSPAPPGASRDAPPAAPRLRFANPTLVGTDSPEPPYEMVSGAWLGENRPDEPVAVLSEGAAEIYEVGVGDSVLVIAETGEHRLRLVGICRQLSMHAAGATRGGAVPGSGVGMPSAALYVATARAEQIAGRPAEVNAVSVALRQGVDPRTFRAEWAERLDEASEEVSLYGVEELRAGLEEGFSASAARNQAYAATGLSLLAGFFIIFTTLNMGVSERVRQLAVLRAVALSRGQVALLVAVEGVALGAIGWIGGLAAGWMLLHLAARAQPSLFPDGPTLGPWCVGLAGVCAFGGALAASILPAWNAARVSPLEAMAPTRFARATRWPWWVVVVGVGLIAVNPLLVFVVPMPDASRYAVYAALGCTSMAIGFVLLAPRLVTFVERAFGPLVAGVFGVNRRLLATVLSSNLWRTLGTTVALSVGLGLYVATQIWGYSMLGPFLPGDWIPDVLVSFQSGGLPDAEVETVRRLPGVVADRCLPLAVEQPRLADDLTSSAERATVTRQDNVVLVGLDPRAGLGGDRPLLDLRFVEGDRETAVARLAEGGHCIIPDHFARAAKLRVGDRFRLVPPERTDETVEYAVAGVVELPGWHWMTKFSGLRRRSGRSAAMVFAAYDDVRRDFDLRQVNFLWMNLDGAATAEQVGKTIQPIADRYLGERQPVNPQGTWEFGATMFGPSVRISTAEEVRRRITARADGMIWAMSRLPLVTLAVTALGVVNAVLASVRTRRWEIGVLRAVGVTRSGVLRLVLAEGLLIGLVACLLSVGLGVTAGWCGTGISQYVSFFGGMNPTLTIPWRHLSIGLGATLLLCLTAAVWPAVTISRAEPLGLLQAGRAAC